MIYRSARATGLGALALALAVITAGCGAPEPAAPATAPVSRATVATSVSATGSLSSTDKANVGFTRGGQLVAVNVKVGDTVQAGQVLARIDPFPAQQSLRTAQTQFDGQQASFNRVVNGTSVDGAENSVDQARRILAATQKQVSAQNAANSRAVDDAERAYDKAKAGAAKAQAAFQQQTQLCTQAQMAAATPPPATTPGAAPQMQMSTASANPVACILLPGAQSAAQMAQQGVQQALATLQQAQNTKKTGEASGRVSIENARNGVVMAQNQLDSSQTDRPSNVEQARASLDGARVGLDNARRDLANTTLRAPIAGKVAALNGAVGEFVNQSSTVTPFAGGSASIPGAATDAGAAGAAGGQSGGASPSRPGGNQFIVLQNPSGFSAVAPFQEVDAVKVQPGQRAEVSVDALPDSTLSGTVLTVSPLSSDISSVINYYVTVAVDRPDPRLRDGQTTRASVITGEGKNALSVPNAAVTKQGDRNSVVVVGPDGRQTPVPFTPGIVGSDRTEVLNGLDEGQQVLLTGNR